MVFISLFLTTVLTDYIFSVHVVNNAGPKVIFLKNKFFGSNTYVDKIF